MISIALRSPLLTAIERMWLAWAVIRASFRKNNVEYPNQEYQRHNPKQYREECENNVHIDDLTQSRS